MAVYNGTNGNNNLTGTGADDIFNPLLGNDNVTGNGGFDTLNVDYSAISSTLAGYGQIYSSGGSFSGILYSSNYVHSVSFNTIEAIVFKQGKGNDTMYVDAAALASGATLSLDGGLGIDTLQIDFFALSGTTFNVAGGGAISSNRGSYASYETFNITLGGNGNSVTTGGNADTVSSYFGGSMINASGGDDSIYSFGSVDTIIGGAGTDYWSGNYSATTTALSFNAAAGTLSNGTTLTGIEQINLVTGSGNDSFTFTGGTGSYNHIDAGVGFDTLNVDYSATGTSGSGSTSQIYSYANTGFSGYLISSDSASRVDLTSYAIESVVFKQGIGDDQMYVQYADAPAVANGATVDLDGGAGTDILGIDFSAQTNVTFTVAAGGAIISNRGTYANYETFQITLGGTGNSVTTGDNADTVNASDGTNTIRTGGGDDAIYSTNGVDTIIGGAGTDYWSGNYSATTTALSFNAAAGTLSNGTTLTGIEQINLVTGSGNDSFTFTGGTGSYNHIDAGVGFDTLTVDYSATGTSGSGSTSQIYSYANTGFSGYLSSSDSASRVDLTSYTVESVVFKQGIGDDQMYVQYADAPAVANGATVDLDGGAGTDILGIDFSAQTNVTFTVAAGGAIISNRGTYANYETFTITGGSGSDVFTGGAGNDQLYGSGGVDILTGGDGDDYLDGGTGLDTASYASATAAVTVNLANNSTQNTIGAGNDTLTSIENLTGSNYNDTLTGNNGVNVLNGGLGNDVLNGGNGLDTASYAGSAGGVTVSLALTVQQNTGAAGLDTLTNLENLLGSDFADTLEGNASANTLDGGAGNDTLSYARATAGVTVTLASSAAQATGGAGSDIVLNFENILGSASGDTLTGDGGANRIEGGLGNDTLNGGAGIDTASYAGASAGVTVSLAVVGAQATGVTDSDTLTNFENLLGSAFSDALTGDGAANLLTGGAGNDTLDGGGADDTVAYTGTWLDHDVTVAGGGYTIADRRNFTPDGSDTASNVEFVSFSGATFAIADTVNVGPVGVADDVTGLVEAGSAGAGQASATGNVLANDTDANLATAGLGEVLTVTAAQAASGAGPVGFSGSIVLQGVYGALTLASDGSYSYLLDDTLPVTNQLAPGQAATDIFSYVLADAHGATSSAQVTVNIAGSADVVVAGDDKLVTTIGKTSALQAAVLLGNDSGQAGETFTVTAVSNAVGATVALVDGVLQIVAKGVAASFDYTVTGSFGDTTTGHVTVEGVKPVRPFLYTVDASVTAADLVGAAGIDKFTGGAGADRLVGDTNADVLDGGLGADVLIGGVGNDTYVIDQSGDVIVENAAEGTDTIRTTLNDYTIGTNFENLTFIGTGAFTGTGNDANNTIVGGAGADTVSGGNGNDILEGGAGDDLLDGGVGGDQASYAGATAAVTVSLAIVGAQNTIGAGTDTLVGFEQLTGSNYGDTLTGNTAGNYLRGGGGRDILNGAGGNDKIQGDNGIDTLTGGANADTFIYTLTSNAPTGGVLDRITDFSHAQADLIDLSVIDPDAVLAGDQAFTFIGSAAFTGAGGTNYEVHAIDNLNGSFTVEGDINHDGVADFALIVVAAAPLVAADFVL